jgi:hypothetical protein
MAHKFLGGHALAEWRGLPALWQRRPQYLGDKYRRWCYKDCQYARD